MACINEAQVLGRLGKDPEIRNTQSGDKVATLSVATEERWKDKQSGQERKETEWHRVVLFGRVAEIAEQYLAKGAQVYLRGQLKTRKWTDQSGQDRYTTEIVLSGFAGKLVLIGGGKAGDRSDHGGYDDVPGRGGQGKPSGGLEDLDDDLPFAPEWQA